MFGSGVNLITTVIGFGMSAAFIVFVCTRLICRGLRGADSRQMFEIGSGIDLGQLTHQSTGLEPVVVAAIPTMKFNSEALSSTEDAQCAICLGEYQEKEVLRIMPKCGHNFHLSCVDVWLRKHSTCPVCRLPLKDTSEATHARLAAFGMPRSIDRPEIVVDHSQQWLLPGAVYSEGSSSNRGHVEAVSRNQESTSGEAEIR